MRLCFATCLLLAVVSTLKGQTTGDPANRFGLYGPYITRPYFTAPIYRNYGLYPTPGVVGPIIVTPLPNYERPPYELYGGGYSAYRYGSDGAIAGSVLPPPMPRRSASIPATIRVRVPATDAQLWFNGVKTKQTGLTRHFVTPPLAKGTYQYRVRVTWRDEQGRPREREQVLRLRPGDSIELRIDPDN